MNNNNQAAVAKPLRVLTYVAAALGLLVGLLALFAALGVWAGLWDFRAGFGLLRVINVVAPWVALLCLLLAIVLVVITRMRRRSAPLLVGVALLGTVAAGLAYYVPESYRPPEGTPPIHDITTDTENPPEFVDVVPLRADAPNSHVYGDAPNMTPEKLAQLQQSAYPDIETHRYAAPRDEVFARALMVVGELDWDLVAENREEGRIEATDTTFWFRFKDDVVIRIREDNGETIVDARSKSRVGVSDVGKNAERLRTFFDKLDEKMND